MSEYFWPLLPESTPTVTPSEAEPARAPTPPGLRLFGRALRRPFQRDEKNSFATASGAELHRSRIGQIIGTEEGEIDWDPTLGSRLDLLRHRPLDETTQELARYYVEDALRRQYRGIRVTRVVVTRAQEGATQAPNRNDIAVYFVPIDARGAPTEVEDTAVVRGR